ncbi:deoxyribonuclease-1-like [Fundulus diaphanus]
MKVAAFNVKKLGLRKVKIKTVSDYLTEILSQYSVVVLLEVMDKSGEAMKLLLKKLNSAAGRNYIMICSSSLGRNAHKEKFACFYRKDEVTLTDQYQYEDNQPGDEDAFDREPFVLRFHCPNTTVGDLVLIPVHTRPRDAFKELDELYDVVTSVKKRWRTTNIMILGDFNAAGPYLSKKKKKKIRINSPPFYWLIDDTADTTTSNSNKHTYDRIVVYGKKMVNAIVPDSATPFNFQEEFGLTKKVALSISDHYPVEVTLKTISATRLKLKRLKLKRLKLKRLKLKRLKLQRLKLKRPSLKRPTLKCPTLKHPTLKHLTLKHPTLKRLKLKHSSLKRLKLKHSSLKRPTLKHPTLKRLKLKHPTLKRLKLKHSSLKRPSLKGPSLKRPSLKRPTLKRATLKRATLKRPTLKRPTLKRLKLKHPSLKRLKLKRPSLKRPTLKH